MSFDWLNEAAALEPTTYVHYLRTRGWRQVDLEPRFPFTRFEFVVDGKTAQVDVPAKSDLGDYRRRVREVVDVLLAVERVTWPELFVRLCNPSVDEFRVRLVGGDLAGGRIGLEDAIRLRVARKQLLLAAAHSVEDPRARFPRLGFAKPTEFLERCHELPVVPGSWISSVQIPVEPAIGSDASVPYARKVTEMLARGLTTVATALGRGGEDQLLHASEHGVSSNFLAALAQLHPITEVGSLEVDMTWARTRPPPSVAWQTLRFGAESFAVFESAANWLREHTPIEDVGLEGHVLSLKRDDRGAGSSEAAGAEIVVLAELEDHERPVKVHVHVPAEDHGVALRAYSHGGRVRVRGTLIRERRTWRLKRPGPLREQTNSNDEDSED
ncbi:hypothetical protein ACNOYE_34355 [Nannocystaceae bacterium ST9]